MIVSFNLSPLDTLLILMDPLLVPKKPFLAIGVRSLGHCALLSAWVGPLGNAFQFLQVNPLSSNIYKITNDVTV